MSLLVPHFEPEHFLTIDFETFYDADYTLKKSSTSDYVGDPRFEVIGVGVFDGEDRMWLEEREFREWVPTVPWDKTAIIGHHQHFDGLIEAQHYGIIPGFHFCTMSMARTFGIEDGVSLDALGQHFGIGSKGFEILKAKGKRRKDFTQAEWEEYGRYCLNDIDLTHGSFTKMVEAGFPEPEMWLIDSTIRMFTEPRLFLNEPLLLQYQADELVRKTALLDRIQMDRKAIGSNETLAKAFAELGVEAPMKLSPKTKKWIYAFAKSDPGMQELLEHQRDEVRWLAEARIAVKSTINETRTQRFLKMGAGGAPMRVYLNYAKAHTYRWAGGDRRNFQNLGRVDPRKPNSGMLKKSLVAAEGEQVVAADSGAIEARGTAWLAGHDELIEGFKLNKDLYSALASEVYGRQVDRKRKPDHPDFHPDDEAAGGLGKVGILGLGYQMGWPKFATTLLAGPMGAAPIRLLAKDADVMGVDVDKFALDARKMKRLSKIVSRLTPEDLIIHCACADKIVRTYRTVHRPIVDLWKTMEHVIETMADIEEGEQFTFGPNECLTIVRHGIILPNGLTLRYPGLRKSEDSEDEDGDRIAGGYSYLGQYGKQRQHIYGGLLTENVVQALSRIIIGEQMNSLKARYGYDTKLSTHDEILTVIAAQLAKLACDHLVAEMKIPPNWAQGWPLNAEGGYAQSYGDC